MDTFDPARHRAAGASPKLDGVNARATRDGLFFKGGSPVPGRDRIKAAVADHFRRNPDAPEISGELYNHGEKFERIIAKVKTGKGRLGFHVFPGQSGPALRGAGVHHVAETPVKSSGDLDSLHAAHLKSGYEGSVIRTDAGATVKRKPLRDAEYPVVSAITGKRGKGALVLAHPNGGTFRAQTTAAVASSARAGQPATVAYHGETEKGVPRSGVVKAIRDYEGPKSANLSANTRRLIQLAAGAPVRRVSRAVCVRGDKVLASRDELGRFWLPGGGIEDGEGPAAAALRELKEETGYAGRVVRISGIWDDETSIRGEITWRNDATGGGMEHTTFVQVLAGDQGKSAPEPGEEKHRYEWFPISEVAESSRNSRPDERDRMLELRRRVMKKCADLMRSDTSRRDMSRTELSFLPAGPDGRMVHLPDRKSGQPDAGKAAPAPEPKRGFFARNRSALVVGALVASGLVYKNRTGAKFASPEEIAKAASRGESFGGAARAKSAKTVATLRKLSAAGHITEFNINSADGFRAVASVRSAMRAARPVATWTKRGAEVAQDADDMASGRKLNKKPFYQKEWFKTAALTGAIGGGIYATRRAAQNRSQIPVPGVLRKTPVAGVIDKVNARHAAGHALLSAKVLRLLELDASADAKGWDLRDARGKSARVFAPGAQRRIRREKTDWEKTDTQRKVRNGLAVAAAAGLAGTGLLFMQNRKLRAAANSAADTARKGLVPVVKTGSGAIAFPGAARA